MSEDKEKEKVIICTPLRSVDELGRGHPHFRQTLEQVGTLGESPYEFYFATMDGGICHARNKMVAKARGMGADWLVFWDHDIQASPDDLLRLLGYRMPIVGALYTIRSNERCHYVANFMHEVTPQKGSLLQVIELGTGLKVYRMSVFDHVAKCLPSIHYTDRDTGERLCGFFQQGVYATDLKPDGDWITEDFFMDWCCRLSRVALFADTATKVRHAGPDGTMYPAKWPPVPGID